MSLQEEEKPEERLRVLDLVESIRELVERPAHELEGLSFVGARLALDDIARDEEVDALGAEPRRDVDARAALPLAAAEPRLLLELAPRRPLRLLPLVDLPGRDLEEIAACRSAELADEDDVAVPVDGNDRDRVDAVDDLEVLAVPVLEANRDRLSLPRGL